MDPARSPRGGSGIRRTVAVIAAGALLAVGAFAVGRISAPVTSAPSTTSAEAGFSRDMQAHHQQAVQLSMIIRDLTDDYEVRLLALDIATGQAGQSGQMYSWLDMWNLPQADAEPSMTWMSRPPITGGGAHGHEEGDPAHEPGSPMPGLATNAQIATLETLEGVDAERYFLQLMIAHHEGGVEMAEAILERTDERVVVTLAKGIVKGQSAEIEYMTDLLTVRGGPLDL